MTDRKKERSGGQLLANSVEWLIERLSEAMGTALVGNNFSPIPSKISFNMKKKWLVAARYLQIIKIF